MTFQLDPGDANFGSALRRIIDERGRRAPKRAELPPNEAVHELRKDARKLRAVLRLARPGLDAFKYENRQLRDAARALSGQRDAAVRVESLDALTASYADEIDRRAFAGLRAALQREAKVTAPPPELDAMIAALHDAARRSAGWEIEGKGREILRRGLVTTLERAARALARAEDDPGPEALHELRKRTKDHRAHMRVLRPLWPRMIRAREKEAKRLSELIGDHHDLDALRAAIADLGLPRDDTVREAICALAARRQADLAAEAMPLARRLFGAPPEDVAGRMIRLWRLWRRETAALR